MKKKLYSISELIDENIKLKKQLNKIQIEHAENVVSLLELIFPNADTIPYDPKQIRGLDIRKLIDGFKQQVYELKK